MRDLLRANTKVPELTYGVLVPAKPSTAGTVTAIDTRAALRAPGVVAVITPFNAPKVPGYQSGAAKPIKGLKLFNDDQVYFNGQPIALVVAETFERATYAARLIKVTYKTAPFETNFHKNFDKGVVPNNGQYKDYVRGEADAYKNAPVIVEQDYMLPSEMHSRWRHVTTAFWNADDKVTLYTKSQGVIGSQRTIANAFGLDPANVQIHSRFVGGAFGSSLRTWPHEIAAVQAAKLVRRPVKLTLTREQMFTLVGYRPLTIQRIGLGAAPDGKLVGITHESHSQTGSLRRIHGERRQCLQFTYYASPMPIPVIRSCR